MIEWKKYDKNNPPMVDTQFIICTSRGFIKIGELWGDKLDLRWVECQEYVEQEGVTHYAEINLP